MKKITTLCVLGIILLFFGLTLSPVMAETASNDTITVTFVDENGRVLQQSLTLTETELENLNGILANLMEKIQSAPDYTTAVSLIEAQLKGIFKNTRMQSMFSSLIKSMFRQKLMYQNNPFNQNVMVMSSGFTNKIGSIRGTHMNMHRYLTFWFYSSNSNLFVNSKTIIVDPYPFNVKTLMGRQIGMMRGFTGLYITQYSSIAEKEYTYFIGHARRATGMDLAL
ncbi:MAG: hypothetical protein V1726_07240 [Methanobacteriota archaeon]